MISRSGLQKDWHSLDRGLLGLRAGACGPVALRGSQCPGAGRNRKHPGEPAKECTGCDSWVPGDPTGLVRFMARTPQWGTINHLLLPTHAAKKLKGWPCAKSPAWQQRSQGQIFAQCFQHSPDPLPRAVGQPWNHMMGAGFSVSLAYRLILSSIVSLLVLQLGKGRPRKRQSLTQSHTVS